jgi:nicotinamidase-related amidase
MTLKFDRTALHLCVDMQRLFAEPSPWFVPWMPRILPRVLAIVRHRPDKSVFTRFVPPEKPDDALGAWRLYYAEWREVTREFLDPRLLELIEPLRAAAPEASVFNKSVYSAFGSKALRTQLHGRRASTLVITGGETDVCVLSTVLAAIDLGYRVVLPVDALCSARDSTHDALLTLYSERFSTQIETTTTEHLLSAWD